MRLQTVLEGFNNTDPFKLLFPDGLHQSMTGDQEHLLNITTSHIPRRDRGLVNNAILSVSRSLGCACPAKA